jgi:hypothetical protein
MSEPALAADAAASIGQEPSQSVSEATGGGESSGFNPAWSPLLEKLPQEFHKLIEPDLRQWDQNFQQKTSEVQSQYEPYKDYVENQVPPEVINNALQLMAVIDADPRSFYENMGKFYADQWGQGQPGSNDAEDESFALGDEDTGQDLESNPLIQQLKSQQDIIAQFLTTQLEQQQQAAVDAQIEAEETALKEEFGEFNPKWVYSYAMQNGTDLRTAVEEYHSFVQQIRSTPTASDGAPTVFAPSSAIPSSQPDPAKMDAKQTRSLVAELLAKAHQEG